MHAKTDSEVTSLAPSSPAPDRSPRRPVYYVQSPSRDSHDGEKTTASFHSTPVLSPMASPRHSHSSVGPHSRESSSSRFSGLVKPGSGSRRIGKGGAAPRDRQKQGEKPWKDDFSVIEEEGLLDDEQGRRGISRRCCYILVFLLGFAVIFTFFSLILWGASRNQKPVVTMKSITFENFIIQAGTDASLVPTDMATLNATVKFTFRNRGTFFGVHVSATPFQLLYDGQLTMATGDMKQFYQSRKGQRNVNVVVLGNKVPLYGGGPSLTPVTVGNKTVSPPVPLSLNFTLKASAYVLGKLVNPKFETEVGCSVTVVHSKLNTAMSLKESCQLY